MSNILYCPRCHRRVQSPFVGGVRMVGKITINCSHCGKGKIVIKGEPQEEVKKETNETSNPQ